VKSSRLSVLIWGAWLFFVGGYAVVGVLVPRGSTQTALSYLLACLTPLFANTTLLWNAATPYRRRNAFWMLLALGCTLWLAGILVLTYGQLVVGLTGYIPFYIDLLFFLHTVPFMAALALAPRSRALRRGRWHRGTLGCEVGAPPARGEAGPSLTAPRRGGPGWPEEEQRTMAPPHRGPGV